MHLVLGIYIAHTVYTARFLTKHLLVNIQFYIEFNKITISSNWTKLDQRALAINTAFHFREIYEKQTRSVHWYRDKNSGLSGQAIKWKAPKDHDEFC